MDSAAKPPSEIHFEVGAPSWNMGKWRTSP
jgi:hypothetical protein